MKLLLFVFFALLCTSVVRAGFIGSICDTISEVSSTVANAIDNVTTAIDEFIDGVGEELGKIM